MLSMRCSRMRKKKDFLMSKYRDLIKEARREFQKRDIPDETVRAFMFELCNEKNIDLYLEKDREADPEVEKKFLAGIERIMNGEPMNYVLGYSYFYGYKMITDPAVLIPRFETEELVGLVLSGVDEHFSDKSTVSVGDVGTGSGAIAVALKLEEKKLEVTASDISKEALEVAKKNAEANGADISFLEGSMLDPFVENGIRLDILVSNPPYIRADEDIEHSVKDFEPHVALFGGSDGLKFYRMILEKAHLVLKEKAYMYFEMGYDQAQNLTELVKQYFPDSTVTVYKDINRKDRMLKVEL